MRAKSLSADPQSVASRSTLRTELPSRLAHLAKLALWKTKHVAEFLNCAEVTVRSWRRTGVGPQFIRCTPRQVRYRPEEVEQWLAQRTMASTSATQPSDIRERTASSTAIKRV